jgi:hypothetical protein
MPQDFDGLRLSNGGAITFFPPDGWAWFHVRNGPPGRRLGFLEFSHGEKPGDHIIMQVDQNFNLTVVGDVFANKFVSPFGSADCAEEFPNSDSDLVDPGTVMIIDDSGGLRASEIAYDKRVAGVVSGAEELKPGIILDKHESGVGRIAIGLMGKVYCKVDADYAPVDSGDLLTTSTTRGHAMKAMDPAKAFGTVLGKALSSLQKGKGTLPILIALQ